MRNILYVFIILLMCCSEHSNKNKNNKSIVTEMDSIQLIRNNNSIKDNQREKDSLKKEIILSYINIPKYIFKIDNQTDYSKYEEFVKLDSLFNLYEKLKLTKDEEEHFTVAKSKKYLLLSNYSKSINELHKIKGNLDDYEKLLLAIAYDLNGDYIKSKDLYDSLFIEIEKEQSNSFDCNKYFIMKVLSGDDELILCKNNVENLNKFKSIGKAEIIKNYFLSDLEL